MDYRYIKEILSHYRILESEAVLLRHNENMTFRVGTEYLVQVHRPVEGFRTQHIFQGTDRMAVYGTELRFLLYLKGQGMAIREPIENRKGELITRLEDGTAVTVSKWIAGESMDRLEMDEERCRRIGALTANLHKCSRGFQGAPVISYDQGHCSRIREGFRKLEGCGLDGGYLEALQNACDTVGTALEKVRDEFQMLHGDLSPSNILETEGGLVAIDFSLFGMGHPMLDLANLFGNINGLSCRQSIAQGYREAGGAVHYGALDACFVLTILGCIAIHFEQWKEQDWFEDRLRRWCRESFEPFSRGERLFADDFYLIHAGS